MKRVCIITTVHSPLDTRIFYREAISLAKKYKVVIVAPSEKDFEEQGIKFIGLGTINSRLQRFGKSILAFRYSLKTKADVYHFHDPELIFVGLALRLVTQKIVIYDIHENNPEFILDKEWIPTPILRKIISLAVNLIENLAAVFFSGVIVVNERLQSRFEKYNKHTLVIRNFPSLEFGREFSKVDFAKRRRIAVYIGGIEKDRGILEILSFVKKFPNYYLKFLFIGLVKGSRLREEIDSFISKENISKDKFEIVPQVSHKDILVYLNDSFVGLIPFLKTRNNFLGIPQKTFEYMAYGLPIVASDFLYLGKYIRDSKSGILIKNQDNMDEYKRALDQLNDSNLWTELSRSSRRAFEKKYNWEKEEKKLLDFYAKLLPE